MGNSSLDVSYFYLNDPFAIFLLNYALSPPLGQTNPVRQVLLYAWPAKPLISRLLKTGSNFAAQKPMRLKKESL